LIKITLLIKKKEKKKKRTFSHKKIFYLRN